MEKEQLVQKVPKWKILFDKSGFNPNLKENFGAGLMCGLLVVLDAPFVIFAFLWNLVLGSVFYLRSFGITGIKEIVNKKSTLGGWLGFLLLLPGLRGWFRHETPVGSISFQQLYIVAGIILAILGIAGSVYGSGTKPIKE